MYNHHLDTFLKAADSGSFLKAAEQMYISANAVTKQVNLLERELGVTLFLRSHQGLKLTEAGELIYVEAKKLIQHSNTVLRKARGLEQPKETVIRVGVSLMNPANLLLEQWGRAHRCDPLPLRYEFLGRPLPILSSERLASVCGLRQEPSTGSQGQTDTSGSVRRDPVDRRPWYG